MESLQNWQEPKKVALVAGASRGLGLLIAKELCSRDFTVVITARDASELQAAGTMLDSWGCRVHPRPCDVRDNGAVVALVREVEEEIGAIEVLITVAGIIQVGPLASLKRERFVDAVDTMLWGPINLALAVLGPMRKRGRGGIGTVASIGGVVSVPHLLPYCTAKFGAVGFSQGLRAELRGSGVSVTTIVPGLMRTGSHQRALFTGNQAAEYAWFSVGASMPLVSMDAERAAKRIVNRVLAGAGMVVLTPLAKIGMRVQGIAPASTTAMVGMLGRLLPSAPPGQSETIEGREARLHLKPRSRSIHDVVTALGARAATKLNETTK